MDKLSNAPGEWENTLCPYDESTVQQQILSGPREQDMPNPCCPVLSGGAAYNSTNQAENAAVSTRTVSIGLMSNALPGGNVVSHCGAMDTTRQLLRKRIKLMQLELCVDRGQ